MAKKKKGPLTSIQGRFIIAGMRVNLFKNITHLCKERHQQLRLIEAKAALELLQDSLKE